MDKVERRKKGEANRPTGKEIFIKKIVSGISAY